MTDDLVTGELVERAARTIYEHPAYRARHATCHGVVVDGPAWDYARACLLTIAPAIHAAGYRAGIERAAVRAPDIIRDVLGWPENDDPDGAVKDSLNEIATAILAEKPSP